MQVELEDYENGRPIMLKTNQEMGTQIKALKAKRQYKQILDLAETMHNTKEKYLLKANALLHLKMWKELATACERGLDLGEDSDFYNLKGKAVGKLGDFQEKAELTKKAIDLQPTVPAYHRNLGAAYYKLKKYEDAIIEHDKAIKLEPNHSINYHNKGAAYYRLGKFQQAKQCFEKAISLDKKQVISYQWLGDSQRELGQLQKAKQAYNRAFEISGVQSYKQERDKIDEKINPDKKKGFFSRIFG